MPQPDIAYVSVSRSEILAKEGIRGAPDLCVEVLSPSTSALDRGTKRLLYARHGVAEYWLVDPDLNVAEVYRSQADAHAPEMRLASREALTTALLPGFSLDLAWVFAE